MFEPLWMDQAHEIVRNRGLQFYDFANRLKYGPHMYIMADPNPDGQPGWGTTHSVVIVSPVEFKRARTLMAPPATSERVPVFHGLRISFNPDTPANDMLKLLREAADAFEKDAVEIKSGDHYPPAWKP